MGVDNLYNSFNPYNVTAEGWIGSIPAASTK